MNGTRNRPDDSYSRTHQMRMLLSLLTFLAERAEFREVDCGLGQWMRDNWPVDAWLNVIWYAVREGYCRPDPTEERWAATLEHIHHGVRLSPIIPRMLEVDLLEAPTRLLILPRGELRIPQLTRELEKK